MPSNSSRNWWLHRISKADSSGRTQAPASKSLMIRVSPSFVLADNSCE
jgi:hypothetical protein